MSYAHIPPLGRVTVDGAISVGVNIKSQVPQVPGMPALATPTDTLNQIMASSPDVASIEGDWAPAIDAAAKIGMPSSEVMKDPGKAASYMVTALPIVMDAAGVKGTGADIAQVAAGFAPQVGALVDGHPGPLVVAGIKTGAAYGCQQLGIPPDIGNITIDAIASGEFSDQTLIAAGGLGGAVGGSALCSLIGIPPCVGGFVGGAAGKFVGGFVSSALHIGRSSDEKKAAREAARKLEAQAASELNSVRQQYAAMLLPSRGTWWAKFDNIIDNFSLQWQALECNITHVRFPLLWSGTGNVNPFFVYPYQASLCARAPNKNLSKGTGCLNSKGILSTVTERGCPEPYGCPYPTFPTIGSDPTTERVLQAFAAYDIWWAPPENRQPIDQAWVDSLPKPNDRPRDQTLAHRGIFAGRTWAEGIAALISGKNGCTTHACRVQSDKNLALGFAQYKAELTAVATEALSLDGVTAAAMRIAGDMTSSAGIYYAAQQINANRSSVINRDYTRLLAASKDHADLIMSENAKLKKAIDTGVILNRVVNYGVLGVGATLFALALTKGRR
jgi:hypothetical protein